jgi:hypothetical protein
MFSCSVPGKWNWYKYNEIEEIEGLSSGTSNLGGLERRLKLWKTQ